MNDTHYLLSVLGIAIAFTCLLSLFIAVFFRHRMKMFYNPSNRRWIIHRISDVVLAILGVALAIWKWPPMQ